MTLARLETDTIGADCCPEWCTSLLAKQQQHKQEPQSSLRRPESLASFDLHSLLD